MCVWDTMFTLSCYVDYTVLTYFRSYYNKMKNQNPKPTKQKQVPELFSFYGFISD